MGWIANRFLAWGRKKQIADLEAFTTALGGMDGSELGLIVALVADVRNTTYEASGDDLLEPASIIRKHPAYILTMNKEIKLLENSGQKPRAAALMVWANSIRGMSDPLVRPYARSMWQQLSRGFTHAEDASLGYFMLTRERLNTYLHDQYPSGLSPTPQ